MNLYYPKADVETGIMRTLGDYEKGFPEGAVIHYTAGNYGKSAIIDAIRNTYAYILIDFDGTVYQSFPLNRWGQHAGDSFYEGLGDHVSKKLVGIEITCGGDLTLNDQGQCHTWYGREVPKDYARMFQGKYYHKYTDMQELALHELLFWLKDQAPDIFSFDHVLGHYEVAPGRKLDPGGSISLPMPDLREFLKTEYLKRRNENAT